MQLNFSLNIMEHLSKQRTLVIFKPDVVQRQIIGEILTRFEKKGFKIVGLKMVWPTEELVKKHYTDDESYLIQVGKKSLKSAQDRGEPMKEKDPYLIGKRIREWSVDYLCCGPVLAIVLEGASVIESVRKMVGKTNPVLADVGTVRADYTPDSYLLSNLQGRTTRTLIHASDSIDSATHEIPLWFSAEEMFEYKTAIEHVLYDAGWGKKK